MFHSVRRYITLAVLAGVLGAVPVLANPTNTTEEMTIDLQTSKNVPTVSRSINQSETHKYQLSLKPGEKVSFKLRADRPTDLKIVADSGVKLEQDGKFYEGTLSGAGDYEIEVSSDQVSL